LLLVHGSILSKSGASGKPGAVQTFAAIVTMFRVYAGTMPLFNGVKKQWLYAGALT
jgi:hypothetical protein